MSSCLGRVTKVSDRFSEGLHRLIRSLSRLDAQWAKFLCKRPMVVFLVCFVVTGGFGCGWIRLRQENSSDVLWVPRNTKSKDDDNWVKRTFGEAGGGAAFYLTVKSKWSSVYGTNAIQLPIIYEAFKLDKSIQQMVATHGGKNYTYADVCYRNNQGVCDFGDVLQYWNRSIDDYVSKVTGSLTDPQEGNQDILIETVNQQTFPDNRTASVLTIYGGLVLSNRSTMLGEVTYLSGAEVVVVSYSLNNTVSDDVANAWYDAFVALMKSWKANLEYSDVAFIANNSADEEIGRSVTDNVTLIIIAIVIFIVVAVLGLSHPHSVATRTLLGLMGVVSAIFALVVGYGLSMIYGIPFTELDEVLPFILLGVAVDCMFILTKAYDVEAARDPSLTLTQRMVKVLSTAGLSVQVTLMASTIAFALGTISELPSIQWFSVYATMSTFCIMISSSAFFMSVFVLTEWRISANRFELFCCCRRRGVPPPLAAVVDRVSSSAFFQSFGLRLRPQSSSPASTIAVDGSSYAQRPSRNDDPQVSAASPPAIQTLNYGGNSAVPKVFDDDGKDGKNAFYGEKKSSSSSSSSSSPSKNGSASPGAYVPVPTDGRVRAFFRELIHQQNAVKFLVERLYAPAITHPIGKVVVLVIFAVYFCISIVGCTRLAEGQPLKDIAPDDSYLQDYIRIADNSFNKQVGSPTNLYFRHLDPSYPEVQVKMLEALDLFLASPYTNSTISFFAENWLISFLLWVPNVHPEVTLTGGCYNPYAKPGRVTGALGSFATVTNITGCVPTAPFNGLLEEFLSVNPGFRSEVLWANGSVWASTVGAVHIAPFDDGKYGRLSLQAVRDVERYCNNVLFAPENAVLHSEQSNKTLHAQWVALYGPEKSSRVKVFMINNGDYLFNEGDKILGNMTLEYVLLALAGVGLVMLVMLGSVPACILMVIAVGLVDLFLFGELWMVGLRFNQVSVICLVMATGLAVDYSVYFTQKFMVTEGTRDERVRIALAETGSAVFLGGISALLGSIPLGAASSAILRTFFALIFGTIVFSLLIGLVLMPVVLSLIGPPTIRLEFESSVDGVKADGGIPATALALAGQAPQGKEKTAELPV